jgi:AraC family transcriptional activator of pyochelin receptor
MLERPMRCDPGPEIDAPVDYSQLLDERCLARVMPGDLLPADGVYLPRQGWQYRTAGQQGLLLQEVARVADDALLIASAFYPSPWFEQTQVVNDSDWLHIQFRVRAGGEEWIAGEQVIETPSESCVVTRYPQGALVHRRVTVPGSYRVACLLLRPVTFARLLDLSPADLPRALFWLGEPGRLALHVATVPLTRAMRHGVNDVLSCTLTGLARGPYMRAKALELLALVVHALQDQTRQPLRTAVTLSPLDLRKLHAARCMITEQPEASMTLAELARAVGMNRTKLAMGFREVYGLPVQTYWRDVRLERARELLRESRARVTDVALSMGYAEVSSFTRAFNRKFGLLPRDAKGGIVPA